MLVVQIAAGIVLAWFVITQPETAWQLAKLIGFLALVVVGIGLLGLVILWLVANR